MGSYLYDHERADNASHAIREHRNHKNATAPGSVPGPPTPPAHPHDQAADLMHDLRHYCAENAIDPDKLWLKVSERKEQPEFQIDHEDVNVVMDAATGKMDEVLPMMKLKHTADQGEFMKNMRALIIEHMKARAEQ